MASTAPCGYQPLLESLGFSILEQEDEGDYQGDSFLLLRDGERWGYLCFGWGSCSGCDALQACDSWKEVEELRQDLLQAIHWFDTEEEALQFFRGHDWEGDYSGWSEACRTFVKKALTRMEGAK